MNVLFVFIKMCFGVIKAIANIVKLCELKYCLKFICNVYV
jgi:hypothetical protein